MSSSTRSASVEEDAPGRRRSRFRQWLHMPHIYVILFGLSVVAAIATYIVPANQFDRVDGPGGREVIDPESYSSVPAAPASPLEFITAVPRGLMDAGEVVFFTFIIGGAFMVVRRTGVIEIALDRLLMVFSTRRVLLIPVLMVVFATLATLIGTQELALVYIPVLLPFIIAMGYDSLSAVAIALVGTTAGFTAGILNPVNTGLGQQIAGIDTFSGAGLRSVLFAVLVFTGALWTMRYASRVSKDPSKSLMRDDPQEAEKRAQHRHVEAGEEAAPRRMSVRQRLAVILGLPVLALTVWGVSTQGWFMVEMAGMFILLMLIIGLVSGLSPSQVSESFTEGMRSVLEGAIIVGLARAVAVMLEDGLILDTIVHSLGELVGGLPSALAAVGMLVAQTAFNFVVPSGSGQAVVTMPVMAPLADLLGVTRQTAVLAYQLGDGPGNIILPTSGYFMAALAIGGVPYDKWVKFFFPLFALWFLCGAGFLITAQAIGWS